MLRKSVFFCLFALTAFRTGISNYLPGPLPFLNLAAPVQHRVAVTGSFGELRNNHFHAGIDLRSAYGVDGDKILAAAGGFVRKVKVDCKNYGNSIFIEHPEGYTTMYAHLSRFRPDIQERIRTEQYRTQQNELELEFGPDDFKVSAGDSIAYMGNSGDSRGTHLHFELRITGTEEVLDPADFGLQAEDQLAPQFRRFKLYGFDLEGNVVSQKMIGGGKSVPKWLIPGDVFAMSVEAYDRNNTSWRTLGIKSLQMRIDQGLFYSFSMDHWSITDTKYINAHLDYRSLHQGRFHRCFKLQGNNIPIYTTVENDGFFYIGDGQEHQVEVTVADAGGNEVTRSFTIQGTKYVRPLPSSALPESLSFDRDWNYDFGFGQFTLKAGGIYDKLQVRVDTSANPGSNALSPWIGIRPSSEPLHHELSVAIRPERDIPAPLMDKCFVALRRGKTYVSLGGLWDQGVLRAGSKSMGYFALMTDTVAPRLVPRNFRFNMTGRRSMSFYMSDNIPNITRNRPGITYNAYIDGQWIVLQHDLKSRTISHEFESWLGNGTHELLVTLEDGHHNKSEYRYNFYF